MALNLFPFYSTLYIYQKYLWGPRLDDAGSIYIFYYCMPIVLDSSHLLQYSTAVS